MRLPGRDEDEGPGVECVPALAIVEYAKPALDYLDLAALVRLESRSSWTYTARPRAIPA